MKQNNNNDRNALRMLLVAVCVLAGTVGLAVMAFAEMWRRCVG